MIGRKDVLSIPYLKKAAFTGSCEGLRFRFASVEKEGADGGRALEIAAWEGPYAYDATPEEKKQRMETGLSEEGIEAGIDWLNKLWESDPERYRAAKGNW